MPLNMRWYRAYSPSVPQGQGALFMSKEEDIHMQIYEELKARGLIAQVTNEEEIP